MKPRIPLSQMGRAGSDPWACPRCGCKGPHKVVNTYEAGGERRRRRVCRNCGQGLIRTAEVPVPEGHKIRVVRDDEEGSDATYSNILNTSLTSCAKSA
jgi:transcriptional regulator NrdR family protein